jgi:hypothetical protein
MSIIKLKKQLNSNSDVVLKMKWRVNEFNFLHLRHHVKHCQLA